MSAERKSIAAISMVRDGGFFTEKWINYYGVQLGMENLFLILDGYDQPLPAGHEQVNLIKLPHKTFSRSKGDNNRSRLVSHFAKALFYRYDMVIAHDIDEMLVVDPNKHQSLAEYLQRPIRTSSLSALGLDVGQHLEFESSIDISKPFLQQRSFAHVSARYTKPVIATRPVVWGSGFHRVKYRNFHIDPNLFLFHFGMVDYSASKEKTNEQVIVRTIWRNHWGRRLRLFDLIIQNRHVDGDSFFRKARIRQTLFRPIYAFNKPGALREKPIIKIPDRFNDVL
jgi:hypothetical protein